MSTTHSKLSLLALLALFSACKPREAADRALKEVTVFGPADVVDLTEYTGAGYGEYEDLRKEATALGVTSMLTEVRQADTLRRAAGFGSIPVEEIVAIRIYTGAAYTPINQALRSADQKALTRVDGIIKSAASGLGRMPRFSGIVRRGAKMPEHVLASFQQGRPYIERAFLSSTFAATVPEEFAGNTTFIIESKKGRKVDWLSRYPDEQEVLFAPGAEFTVQSKVVSGAMTTIRLTQSPGAVPNPELKARAHAQQMVDQLGVVFANCRFTLTGIANVSQNGQYDLDLVARRIDITRIERLNDVPSRIGSGLDAFTDVVEERMSTAGCARGQSYSEDTVLTARAKQHLTEVFQVLNTKLANCSFSLNAVFDASPNGEYGFSFTARRLDTGKTFTFELEADFNVDAFTDAESYRPLLKDELRASGCVWKGGARVPTSTTSISLKKAASDHVRSAFIALNQRMTNCKVTLIAVTDAFANGEYKYGFSLMQGVGQQQHLDDWTSSTTASIEEEIASYREEFASLKTGCLFK